MGSWLEYAVFNTSPGVHQETEQNALSDEDVEARLAVQYNMLTSAGAHETLPITTLLTD